MEPESALLLFLSGVAICVTFAYGIWGPHKNFAQQLIELNEFISFLLLCGAGLVIFMSVIGYFSPDQPQQSSDPDAARWRSYSQNKESRDYNVEHAQSAMKKGNDGEAQIWIQKAQESQERMNNR